MTQGLQCPFCYQVHLNQMEDRACSCQCHQPIPAAVEKANSLQVGKTIACGHCEPEKYAEGLKQAEAAIPGYVCECVCHSKPQPAKEWWEEFDKLFPSFSELEISAIGATAPFFTIEEKAEVHTKQLAMREHNNKLRYIKSFIAKEIASAETRIAAQSEKKVIEQFFEIEKNKWKDAQHCTCLSYALIEVSGGEDSVEGQKMQERLLGFARSSE